MKIVIFGATGNIGQRLASEAPRRGHAVVGVVRDPERVSPADARMSLVKGDATDPRSVASVSRGADAVVGPKQSGVRRVIWVGGAGTLEVAPGKRLMDTPEFPDAWKGEANEGAAGAHRAPLHRRVLNAFE